MVQHTAAHFWRVKAPVTKEVAGAFAFLELATGGTRRTAASRGKAEVRELGLLCGAVVYSACFGTKKRGVRGEVD